jgi:Protein of unknown function (DUF998)
MSQPTVSETSIRADQVCRPQDRVTRSLLGYGVIAGPIYVVTSLAQALTRDGFDLSRHEWSLLANGAHGWIQIANFIVTGLMVIAFAVGLRRALRPQGPELAVGARWAPRLIAVYGLGLIAAGVFRADPAQGFPVGTPQGATPVSWVGMLHFTSAAVGFSGLAVACFVLARRYGAEHRRGWAIWSRLTGGLFVAGFALVGAGGGSRAANLGFTAAVILVWAWLSAVATERYRYVATNQ